MRLIAATALRIGVACEERGDDSCGVIGRDHIRTTVVTGVEPHRKGRPFDVARAQRQPGTAQVGNEPEAEFGVEPKITLDPTSGAVSDVRPVRGTGFDARDYLTITVDGFSVSTTPPNIRTKHNGSFIGSFLVPVYAVDNSKIAASDSRFNRAEAELTILANISLNPVTSQTSPGYVVMELTVYGTGFIAGTKVTITYNNTTVETATTDSDGNFRTTFVIPPSIAGSHAITVTDGINTLTSTFTMESAVPPISVLLLPEIATIAEAEAYFDWKDITDPSGITYSLQIGTDANFNTIVLEKEGLTDSEYTITKEEKLKSTEADAPTYCRD